MIKDIIAVILDCVGTCVFVMGAILILNDPTWLAITCILIPVYCFIKGVMVVLEKKLLGAKKK